MNERLSEAQSGSLIEAIQNGEQDAWVEAHVEARLAAVRALLDRYAGRSKWVGYERPRREAWAEIETDLRAALKERP